MKKVVKKPSRAFTAERSRTASSSTAATALRGPRRGPGGVGGHGRRRASRARAGARRCRRRPGRRRARRARVRGRTGATVSRVGGRARTACAAARGRAGPGQRGARLGLRGERAGHGGGGEAGVGQREPQRVDMADEAGVDEGDAVGARDRGEQRRGLGGVGGGPYVEAQRPQIALERRSGYRRTGEDGGRQTNSLLGADGCGRAAVRPGYGRRHVGRGYRMNGSGSSPPVYAPLGMDRPSAAPRAIIIVDRGLAPQTARPPPAIRGLPSAIG